MSRPQPKSTEICAEPRVVSERTSCTPGTVRIASSTGRVTSSAVWSAGRLPAFRSTTTRGNETCGNSPTGSDSAETAPAAASASASTTMVRACRSTNCGETSPLRFLAAVRAHGHPVGELVVALHDDGRGPHRPAPSTASLSPCVPSEVTSTRTALPSATWNT